MATAEQMALVALQYCIGSEAECLPLLMMIVPVIFALSYWLVLEIYPSDEMCLSEITHTEKALLKK